MTSAKKKRVSCIHKHTPHPEGYVAHMAYMEEMSKTHKQKKCKCGLWAIWVPKTLRIKKDCTNCRAYDGERCDLNKKIETTGVGYLFHKPLEICEKPRTYKRWLELRKELH